MAIDDSKLRAASFEELVPFIQARTNPRAIEVNPSTIITQQKLQPVSELRINCRCYVKVEMQSFAAAVADPNRDYFDLVQSTDASNDSHVVLQPATFNEAVLVHLQNAHLIDARLRRLLT